MHLNQLNLRLTDQGRQLEAAGERIELLSAELRQLTAIIEDMRISERAQPSLRRDNHELCGMRTLRGTPCTNRRATCVYRAAGRHMEQRGQPSPGPMPDDDGP